jgi:hypothetical protein
LEPAPALPWLNGGGVLPLPTPPGGTCATGVGDSISGAATAPGGDGLAPRLSRSKPAATAGSGGLARRT